MSVIQHLSPTVSQLIACHLPPTEPGAHVGTCYVCGLVTDRGQRRPPSDGFTAWATCARGDVLCPDCAATLGCRDVRMFSWLVTPETFRIHGRGDRGWLWDVFTSPPEPPFGLYLTKGGQKQGWICGVRQIATSRQTIPVLTDWADRPVLLRRVEWDRLAPLVCRLRARGLSKRAIMTGEYRPNQWKRAIAEGYVDELRQAQEHAGDPRWEIIGYVSNDPDGGDELSGPDAATDTAVRAGAATGRGGAYRAVGLGLPLG